MVLWKPVKSVSGRQLGNCQEEALMMIQTIFHSVSGHRGDHSLQLVLECRNVVRLNCYGILISYHIKMRIKRLGEVTSKTTELSGRIGIQAQSRGSQTPSSTCSTYPLQTTGLPGNLWTNEANATVSQTCCFLEWGSTDCLFNLLESQLPHFQ